LGFAFIVGRGYMPALFAYLLAVSLLLGGGYASLHWLSTPPDASINQRQSASKRPPASKDMVEKSDPYVTGAPRAEKRPNDHAEMEIPATAPTSEASIKAAPEAPLNETGVSEENRKLQTKKADDVPAGGCMPIGLTAQGELVFPMQRQELLELHRGPVNSQPPVSTNSTQSAPAPKERQAAEPARPVGDENTGLTRTESPSRSRRAGFRTEEQWFNPLTFR
jgi:hypothetical protein